MIDWVKVVHSYLRNDTRLWDIFDKHRKDNPVILVDALMRMRGPIAISRKYHGENVWYEKYFVRMNIFEPEIHSNDIIENYPELLNEEVDDILLTNKCGCWFFDVSLADVSTTDKEVERIAAEDNGKPMILDKLVPIDVDDEGNGWYRLENEDEIRERMIKYGRSIKDEH